MQKKRLAITCLLGLFIISLLMQTSCARYERKTITITAYCPCGKCCDWKRGSKNFFSLDFWNKYVSKGTRKGKPYDGLTASCTKPRQVNPGLFSSDSLREPWMIPMRIVCPWLLLPRKGTIAADTRYYPFGTEIYVPGYGWGVVEDRGGAIKGSKRLDLFYRSHTRAMQWGRQTIEVKVVRKKK